MISVLKTDNYDFSLIKERVDRHFALLELDGLFHPGMKVVIKPNLLMKRRPEEGTTAHPALVEAVILHLKELGVEDITVADSPGGLYNKQILTALYKTTGIEEAAQRQGVMLNFDVGSTHVGQPAGQICKTFELINPIVEADAVISVCKLKSHCMTGLSGGVKNLFGTIPGLMKPEFHWRFPKEEDFCTMLVDLCETVRPVVTLVDAVISMEGDGPSSGTLRETGYTFCARSPYELDLVLEKVIGRETGSILTVKNAIERGLCPDSPEKVSLCGDPLPVFADFKMPKSRTVDFISSIPKPLRGICTPIIKKCFSSRPRIDTAVCVGCGRCAESCPAHTIRIVDKKARIDRSKCIKCYCCHEMCPVHAISVKRNRLFNL